MTASERERVEREARKCASEHYSSHPARLAAEILALVLRERAAAFEAAAKECGPCDDCGGQHMIRALAAQERAQAGEGGGRG